MTDTLEEQLETVREQVRRVCVNYALANGLHIDDVEASVKWTGGPLWTGSGTTGTTLDYTITIKAKR